MLRDGPTPPDGGGFYSGMGTSAEVVLGYYFFVDLDGITLSEQFAAAEDLSYYEDCLGTTDTSDGDYCTSPGCSVSAGAENPFFGHYTFGTWTCGPLENISYQVRANGANLPTSTAPSYMHVYTSWGDDNLYTDTIPPTLECQYHVRGNSDVALSQDFDVDEKEANFSIGWRICFRFVAAGWGPVEYRLREPGGGLAGSPAIGDYVSFPRSIVVIQMIGMSPNRILGIVRMRDDGQMIADGENLLGAPDGAGLFNGIAFDYSQVPGTGDDFSDLWAGTYSGSLSYSSYVGPGVIIDPIAVNVDLTYGDVDEDGVIDPDDETALESYIKGSGKYDPSLDFNRDSQLTSADVTALNALMGTGGFRSILLGDVDADWDIDSADLTAISAQISKQWGDAQFAPQADIDGDGVVTTADEDLLDDYLN